MTATESPPSNGPPPVLPAVKARQGVISGRVLKVLIASLSLSIVALVVTFVIFR